MKQQLDDTTLEECRRNPVLAATQQPGLVVCLECGLLVRRLTRSPNCHARREHNLDATAYLANWPGAPLQSDDTKQDELTKHYAYQKANCKVINEQRRLHYEEICKIAERDPASPEAAWLKKQHDRSAASWKNLYRGAGDGDKEAEAFRKSESDRRRKRHEANKEQDNERNRKWYQANLETERPKHREKQKKIRELAWRPPGWNDKPIEWRIIGSELLSQDSMSNKELAARLDDSRIITSPYGKQTTWTAAVEERAFKVAVNRIRTWVKRPGREAVNSQPSSQPSSQRKK